MLDARTTAAIAGAVELFLGRRDGLRRFDLSVDGFWHSFSAALYGVPFFLCLMAGDWAVLSAIAEPPTLSAVILSRIADFTLDFLFLPIVLALLAKRLGITRSYTGFVIARNWSTLVMLAPQAVISLLLGFRWLDQDLAALLSLVVAGVMLAYEYRIARWTLGWDGAAAAGLVAADVVSGLVLVSLVNGLFGT